jgi:hypothetical protein
VDLKRKIQPHVLNKFFAYPLQWAHLDGLGALSFTACIWGSKKEAVFGHGGGY